MSENQRKGKEPQIHRPCQRAKKTQWNKKVMVLLVVIGILGTISKSLIEELETGGRAETIQQQHFWGRPEYWEESWRLDLFGFFASWHTNLRWLFNAKAILLEEQLWCYLTHCWENRGVHAFPNGICPKVNVIARLVFKLAFNDSAVMRFNR